MNIAYLLLVHANPVQVNRLIQALDNGKNHFFIHVDFKSDIRKDISVSEKVHFVEHPHSVKWGDFSLVKAMISLCRSVKDSGLQFDYCVLLSGQDYPIKSNEQIEQFFQQNKGKQFFKVRELPFEEWEHHSGGFDRLRVYFPSKMIDRSYKTWFIRDKWIKLSRTLKLTRKIDFFDKYYGVSQWFCATQGAVEYILRYIDENPTLLRFFKNTFIPDEIFFNTIIMNSPFEKDVVPTDLRLVEWTNTSENPKVWRKENLDYLLEADYLFARKFDIRKDKEIFDLLDQSFGQ